MLARRRQSLPGCVFIKKLLSKQITILQCFIYYRYRINKYFLYSFVSKNNNKNTNQLQIIVSIILQKVIILFV